METIFYHPDTTKTKVSFDTTRKGADVATLLRDRGRIVGVPTPATRGQIARCHTTEYIRAIETGEPARLASSQQFPWDADTWASVAAQSGAMLAAVSSALAVGHGYALASGFHHARADRGAGFCTFNGLAIAAADALDRGVRQVIILDLDAHHGGGTSSIVGDWAGVLHLDVSTASFDMYEPREPHRLAFVTDASAYLATVESMLAAATSSVAPGDLVLYNAGMDIYEGCQIGGLRGITADIIAVREQLVAMWIRAQGLRVAACLAGGYAGQDFPHEDLIALHAASVATICPPATGAA